MKDIKKSSKIKLVVSFNGEFKVIYIDPLITFDELKSKINEVISNDVVLSPKMEFLYKTQFCDGGKKEVGYIESDDDVRRMIRGVEGVGDFGILVFACRKCCDVEKVENVGNGGLRENLMTQLAKCEKDWKFRVLEEESLENELDGIEGLDLMSGNECFDGRVIDLGGFNDDSDFSFEEKDLGYGRMLNNLSFENKNSGRGSQLNNFSCEEKNLDYDRKLNNLSFEKKNSGRGSRLNNLSFEEKNLDYGSQLYSNVEGDENFGEGLIVPLLDSGKQNQNNGKSCMDENRNDENGKFGELSLGLVVGSWGQGSLILESEDGVDEEHSNSGKTSLAVSDSSLVLNTDEEEDKSRKGIHNSCESNLSINRKDKDKNVSASASSKAYDRMSAEVAACYNHLESIKLQTIKYSDLEFIKKLGEGAYGIVHYGKWNGSDVAIKRLKLNCSTEGTAEEDRLVKDFWKEAQMLGKLHHPNIVALYGVVTDGPPKYLAAVTEYMVNGSLKQVLRRRDRTIDRRKRVIIARDAASGMEYLHENNIVHFDLKSHNLLVNMKDPQRPICKIGDLGLSKIKQRSIVSGGFRGTLPWMAPELFDAKCMVTEKVDVYSFGIVMWELLTGETPYADMRSKEIIAGMIKGDMRPEIPSWCDPVWRSLMERCWSSDPVTRPSFIEIVNELRAMAASMNIKEQ